MTLATEAEREKWDEGLVKGVERKGSVREGPVLRMAMPGSGQRQVPSGVFRLRVVRVRVLVKNLGLVR